MKMAEAVFVGAGVLLVYVLFLYPALLRVFPPRFRRAAAGGGGEVPAVTVILAVRNGEQWIRRKLDSIAALEYDRAKLQIIVASDGSTDATEELVRGRSGLPVELLALPPGGKASAINAALRQATGEILFFTDVRQALEPNALRELVHEFADPRVGVVSGELIIRAGATLEEHNVGLYWRYEKWIRKQHSRIDSVMGATGAIYAMRRTLARPLPPFTILDDVYLPIAAFLDGYRVVFTERAKAFDSPTALKSEFSRKVRTQAGMYQLIGQFPELLGPKNRMWVHFLSHKVGRLMLPFLLLALLVSSAFLAPPLSAVALALQAVFYGLALLDPLMRPPVKRLSSVVRTFVVLSAAALAAASILFRPAESFWKPARR